jgi:hypothetical protein
MHGLKQKAIFVAEVAVAFAVVYAFQKKVMVIPVVGMYLPGGQ